MRYIYDHDLHIHSQLSLCSSDPEETPDRILAYGKQNGLKLLCLTDHFWDETVPGASNWYQQQNYTHISLSKPLPQAEGIRFLFGCETEMDRNGTIGCSRERMEELDFIIVPTTHLHMSGFTCRGDEGTEERARLWVERFDCLLAMDVPFRKMGIAHLTCSLLSKNGAYDIMRAIPLAEYHRLFAKSAKCGLGIELNFDALNLKEEDTDAELLPYRIAMEEGCRFYLGSDAHHPKELDAEKKNAERIIDLLGLKEDMKFVPEVR